MSKKVFYGAGVFACAATWAMCFLLVLALIPPGSNVFETHPGQLIPTASALVSMFVGIYFHDRYRESG